MMYAKKRPFGILCSLFVCTLMAGVSGCSAVKNLAGLDCLDDPTEAMARHVYKEVILEVLPETASSIGEKYVSLACEDDDGIAEVGRRYQFTSSPMAVASHYEREAIARGWRLIDNGATKLKKRLGSTEHWLADTCYRKGVGNFTADLELSFDYWSLDVEESPSIKTYWLEISFSPEGGNCRRKVHNY